MRIWIVDPRAKTITVFAPAALPITYRDNRPLTDDHFSGLNLVPQTLFAQARLLA